jgi:segregation and condensation protein B
MDRSEKRRLAEALILASAEPISAARLAEIIPYCKPGQAKDLVNELNTEYQQQDRAFEIWEVAGGFQIRTRAEFSGYLQRLQKQRPMRLSRAALETLAILAYKQPATRAEIESVRGVDVGAVIKSLLDRDLAKMLGHREVPGRPMLYGTTKRFLEVFGLDSLKNLPTLRDLEELTREHEAAQAVIAEEAALREHSGLAEGEERLPEGEAHQASGQDDDRENDADEEPKAAGDEDHHEERKPAADQVVDPD